MKVSKTKKKQKRMSSLEEQQDMQIVMVLAGATLAYYGYQLYIDDVKKKTINPIIPPNLPPVPSQVGGVLYNNSSSYIEEFGPQNKLGHILKTVSELQYQQPNSRLSLLDSSIRNDVRKMASILQSKTNYSHRPGNL